MAYLDTVRDWHVFPAQDAIDNLRKLEEPMRRADRTMPPVPHGLDGGAFCRTQ